MNICRSREGARCKLGYLDAAIDVTIFTRRPETKLHPLDSNRAEQHHPEQRQMPRLL
jgi:hypothetical protein